MQATNLDLQLNDDIASFSERVDKLVAEFKKEDTQAAAFPTIIFTKYLPVLQPVAAELIEKYSFLLTKVELDQFKVRLQQKIEKGIEILDAKI